MKKEQKGKLLGEFKTFIARGNVMDMAVGIIMGTAFTKIVNTLVNSIIMPAIGAVIGGLNFSDFKIVLAEATETTAENAIYYGQFIQAIIDFLLIAIVVFMMVKFINKLHKKKEVAPPPPPAPPKPSDEVVLLTEIRDLLKK